jgi:hypothetical protein
MTEKLHQTADFDLHPAEGWYSAQCTCGFTEGPFPDAETMVDALMEHAYHAGVVAGVGRAGKIGTTQSQPAPSGMRLSAAQMLYELVDVLDDLIFEHRIDGLDSPPDWDQTGAMSRFRDRLNRAQHFVAMGGQAEGRA